MSNDHEWVIPDVPLVGSLGAANPFDGVMPIDVPMPLRLEESYHDVTAPRRLMETVDASARALEEWLKRTGECITHLVCTGVSGQSIAWPMSYKLGIPVCVVRKPNEDSHAGSITGRGRIERYVIVDDIISTGNTIKCIRKALDDAATRRAARLPVCAAILLFRDDWRKGNSDRERRERYAGVPLIVV